MIRWSYFIFCTPLLFSCGEAAKKEVASKASAFSDSLIAAEIKRLQDSSSILRLSAFKEQLTQEFIGKRGSAELSIFINYMGNRSLVGYNIQAGKKTNFKGNYEVKDNTFFLHIKEAGNSETDGYYDLSIRLNDSVLTGKWTSYLNAEKTELVKVEMWRYNRGENLDTTSWFTNIDFCPEFEPGTAGYSLVFTRWGKVKLQYYENFSDDKSQLLTFYGKWSRKKLELLVEIPKSKYLEKSPVVFKINRSVSEIHPKSVEDDMYGLTRTALILDGMHFYPNTDGL